MKSLCTASTRPEGTRKAYRPSVETLDERLVPAEFVVAPGGSDSNPGTLAAPLATIQRAINAATQPGDVVSVRSGTYKEKLVVTSSGAAGNPIVIQAFPGERPVLTSPGRGGNMVLMTNVNHVKVVGFDIGSHRTRDGSGIRILGRGDGIELRNNVIHDIRGRDAMGITVYGTDQVTPISNLTIDGNQIFRCQPFESETLVLNGNVTQFVVSNNVISNVNNIGIDIIGGEKSINPVHVARNGVVRGNVVSKARASDGDGDAAGIYVDGGRDVIVENNTVTGCDYGIEVGAENRGIVATGIVVRNNVLYRNRKAGLIFGGFERRRGRVRNCQFVHNVLFRNDTSDSGDGQLVVQFAEDNLVAGNILSASSNGVLWTSERGARNNVFDFNLYFTRGGANDLTFLVNGREFFAFNRYQRRTGLDAHSRFGDPLFANPLGGDFRLGLNSPAIDAGSADPTQSAPKDINGQLRPLGPAPDAGVFEVR